MSPFVFKTFNYTTNGVDLLKIFQDQPHLFFLDSSQFQEKRGRYSFLGFAPFEIFQQTNKHAIERLREKFYKEFEPMKTSLTPFPSGIVGFLSYDFGLKQEKVPLKVKDACPLPDCYFGFYDCVLTIDHLKKKLHVVSTGLPEKNFHKRKIRAQKKLKDVCKKIETVGFSVDVRNDFVALSKKRGGNPRIESNFTKAKYKKVVQKCLKHIEAGDIYQVNLSQRFSYPLKERSFDPIDAYLTLRALSPSCFGAYLDCGPFQIISSSPERFLSVKGQCVQTRPMKGTRPRGKSLYEDEKLKGEILKSQKEKAELLMITDLLRNDLGRVCRYGSVHVKELRALEKYETVYQTTSTVEGMLHKDKDMFDLLKECSPGGSITGCPKIRSMEIIENLEPTRRGIYTGSLGYMSVSSIMDFNIIIRTFLALKNKVTFQVGGGIVSDSDPESEYQETLVKAKALMNCLEHVLHKKKVKNNIVIYLDEKEVLADEHLLKELSPGCILGKGVFETMRLYKGKIFSFDLHWERLLRGLQLYGIKNTFSSREILRSIFFLAKKNKLKEARVRLSIWRDNKKLRSAIVCQKGMPLCSQMHKKGMRAIISSKIRYKTKFSHIKSLDYGIFKEAFEEAQAQGAQEAILCNRKKKIVEGSRSNIFIVKKGVVLTPPVASGCLNGVTRRLVIDLARKNGIKCVIADLTVREIEEAEEVFMTNSIGGIIPLIAIGNKTILKGSPGPITKGLFEKYLQYLTQ